MRYLLLLLASYFFLTKCSTKAVGAIKSEVGSSKTGRNFVKLRTCVSHSKTSFISVILRAYYRNLCELFQ